jgi:hypothetical protein
MISPIDDATEPFLPAARDDLQRELFLIGIGEVIGTAPSSAGVGAAFSDLFEARPRE